jgi:hypothetical protein
MHAELESVVNDLLGVWRQLSDEQDGSIDLSWAGRAIRWSVGRGRNIVNNHAEYVVFRWVLHCFCAGNGNFDLIYNLQAGGPTLLALAIPDSIIIIYLNTCYKVLLTGLSAN